MTEPIRVSWNKGFQFVASDEAGHSLILDAAYKGANPAGMRPMDTLLAALAACTGMDIVQGMLKYSKRLEGLEISVTGEKNPSPPHYYTKVNLHYKIYAKDIEPSLIEKIIEDSKNLYCSVGATISGKAEIEWTYELASEYTRLPPS